MKTDILILGGGSAGFGATYRALQHKGLSVTVVDANEGFGGTSTYGGVNCWEPGYGGYGVHHILAQRLMASGQGFVGKSYGAFSEDTPWGVSKRCDDPYEETLIRSFRNGQEQRRFHFEPQAMADTMLELLRESGNFANLHLLFNSRVENVTTEERKITAVTVNTPEGTLEIHPKLVLDCTGDIAAARLAGCEVIVGEDAQTRFQEPNAPENPQRNVNGMSLVFRVTPCDPDFADTMPDELSSVDISDWKAQLYATNRPAACFNDYPNGDININMLPTLPGECFLDLPREQVERICRARVYAYWNWVQTQKHFRGYRIAHIFPMLGVRESWRLVGQYVLKEQDLRNGFSVELGAGHSVAFADHPADIHGSSNKKGGMTMFARYGIPYECMLPKETDNLLVACRGSSFSHIAASSARLSRTMLAWGEAAGEAAAQCMEQSCAPASVDVKLLRKSLHISENEP